MPEATVFLARDPRHNRKVAIKVMRREIASLIGIERFLIIRGGLGLGATTSRATASGF